MAIDPDDLSRKRHLMADDNFTELCDALREFDFPKSPERSQRWGNLRARIEAKGTGALSPDEFVEFGGIVTEISKCITKQGGTRPAAAR